MKPLSLLPDLLDFILSAMDRIPLSVGDDRSGASSSKQPSFDLNVSAVEQAVYEQRLEKIKNQKQTLADLLDPLIKREARKFPDIKKLPSPTDVVEQLISRIGSNKARAENNQNAPLDDFRNLKTWLTRACQNAPDETKGRLPIRSEIRAIIQEYSQNDSENSLSFPDRIWKALVRGAEQEGKIGSRTVGQRKGKVLIPGRSRMTRECHVRFL